MKLFFVASILATLASPVLAEDGLPPVSSCQPTLGGQPVGPRMTMSQVYAGGLAALSRQRGVNGPVSAYVTSGAFPTGANGVVVAVPQQQTVVVAQALTCF